MSEKLEAGERWKHVKRGTFYDVIGHAELQNGNVKGLREGADLVVYRGEDGKLWARDAGEFADGRFVPVAPATVTETAKVAGPVNFMETSTRRVTFDPPAHVTDRMVAQLAAGEPVDGGTDVPKVSTPANGEQVERVRDAIVAGLRGFCVDEPDFTMSRAMLTSAADHILSQPGIFPTPTQDARERVKVLEEALKKIANHSVWADEPDSVEMRDIARTALSNQEERL